jgi:hypothetical protein
MVHYMLDQIHFFNMQIRHVNNVDRCGHQRRTMRRSVKTGFALLAVICCVLLLSTVVLSWLYLSQWGMQVALTSAEQHQMLHQSRLLHLHQLQQQMQQPTVPGLSSGPCPVQFAVSSPAFMQCEQGWVSSMNPVPTASWASLMRRGQLRVQP